jgi:glycosyltransferase involved in cell wall biosynthesis
MRVLMVHNEYLIPGGEDESTRVEEEVLRQNGVEVESYRVNNVAISELAKPFVAVRTIWSRETYRNIQQQLRKRRCDIVHVQNFFPLISPAVYYAARDEGAAVVQTLRNYRLLCPNALFYRDGRSCEDCLQKWVPWPAIVHRCYRGSALTTAGVAAMLVVHRAIKTWTRQVDMYVALTEFARAKFVSGGLPPEKIAVKPNCVLTNTCTSEQVRRGSFLYIGRLCEEKGVPVLLDAWRQIGRRAELNIAGTGPLAELIQAAQNRNGIKLLGQCGRDEIAGLLRTASCLIFPSRVYEVMPRAIIEAFAAGTPVIASNLGAMADMVRDGVTGLHFTPGDAAELATKIQWVCNHPEERAPMSRAARLEYERCYTAKRNFSELMSIYERALCSRTRRLTGIALLPSISPDGATAT